MRTCMEGNRAQRTRAIEWGRGWQTPPTRTLTNPSTVSNCAWYSGESTPSSPSQLASSSLEGGGGLCKRRCAIFPRTKLS